MNELDKLLARLDDPHRALKYMNQEDQCRTACSELIVKSLIPGTQQILRFNTAGEPVKPHINLHEVFFNISHDSDIVVVASHPHVAVGVDIMKIQPPPSGDISEFLNNLRSIFHPSEWEYMTASDKGGVLERFYHVWTAKEAVLKCIGTGLYTELDSVKVDITDHIGSVLHACVSVVGFDMEHFSCIIYNHCVPGYTIAVCCGPASQCDPSWLYSWRPNDASEQIPDKVEFIFLDTI